MHTVVETPAYLKADKASGMTDAEMTAAVDLLSDNPEAGAIMQGTGGCRKVRLAGRGHGKSGGYRLITFFARANRPIYLLTVFGKGEKANLTAAEKSALAGMVKRLT